MVQFSFDKKTEDLQCKSCSEQVRLKRNIESIHLHNEQEDLFTNKI